MDTSLIRDGVAQEEIEQRVQLQLNASTLLTTLTTRSTSPTGLAMTVLEMMHHSGVPVIRHLCTSVFLIHEQRYCTMYMALRPPELE